MKHCFCYLLFISFNIISFSQTGLNPSVKLQPSKPPIDSIAVANWPNLGWSCIISADGKYFLYLINNLPVGSNTLVIQATESPWKKEYIGVEDGKSFFTNDSKQAIFFKPDTIFILELGSANLNTISNVSSCRVPSFNKGTWLAYKRKTTNGKECFLYNFISQKEQHFPNAVDYYFEDSARVLLVITQSKHDSSYDQALNWIDLKSGITKQVWAREDSSSYTERPESYYFDRTAAQLTFSLPNKTNTSIWYYNTGLQKAVLKVNNESEGLDSTLAIKGNPKFSYNGRWIFFEIKKKNKSLPKPSKEAVMLDIWSYKDPVLHPEQMRRLLSTEEPTFKAAINTKSNNFIRLEGDDEDLMTGSELVTGDYIILKDQKSIQEFWWKLDRQPSYYLMDLKKNERRKIANGGELLYYFSFSPSGRFVTYWDMKTSKYYALDVNSSKTVDLTRNIVEKLSKDYINQIFLKPVSPIIGWYKDESALLLYDNYDIWKIDPLGTHRPQNITNGYGLKNHVKLRLVYEPENLAFEGNESLLLTGFNFNNKYNGFYQINLKTRSTPQLLHMGPYTFYRTESQKPVEYAFDNGMRPKKSANSLNWIVKRQSSTQAPNYYLTKDFKTFTSLSNLQPQKDYNWLTTELITWKMLDGKISQGILYKPEDFNPNKKYPVIFYYYEAFSHMLYEYAPPSYAAGAIHIPWLVSKGYLVFTPDIYYKPAISSNKTVGEWAYNSVVSAAKELSKRPYIDSKKMGIQGHSFGGLETSYLVTHTNIFAAAAEASGSTDPISAYLTLVSLTLTPRENPLEFFTKQVSIETGHELYGCTPWERPDLWARNSAILNADKVTTPLLIMHCKNDNQVQWRQGVEFYMALRRLHKKVWMLQYDNGNHVLFGNEAIDYTKRLTQFFDHYLKNKPAPAWMTKGVSIKLKGVENGFELPNGKN